MRTILRLSLFLTLLSDVASAQLSVVYKDSPSSGFFSQEARVPVGGNSGTTLGEQRRIVMQRAIERWSQYIDFHGPVVIEANFESLPCDQFSAVLAGAGPITTFMNFPGAPETNVLYVGALANHLTGSDKDPNKNEIVVKVNSAVDTNPNCGGTGGFYYGLDGQSGNQTPLLRALIHELAHGLGFTDFINFTNGNYLLNVPSSYDIKMFSLGDNKLYRELTSAKRLKALAAGPQTVWSGRNTQLASVNQINGGISLVTITRSSSAVTSLGAQANFGPDLPAQGMTGHVVLVNDGVAPVTDACQPLVNAAALAGKIALIDRGGCAFTDKALAAQAAGAIAVIIANNVPDKFFAPDGAAPFPNIPTILVTQAEGQQLRTLGASVTVTLLPSATPGVSDGRPFLYTPNVAAPGSSLAHFDGSTTPDLLMSPTGGGGDALDLTLTVMRDIGWDVKNIPFPNLDFELWSEINELTPGGGMTQDSDADGATDFNEYSFGSDPSDASSRPRVPTFQFTAGNAAVLGYTRSNQAVDLSYRVEKSPSLAPLSWQEIGTSESVTADGEVDQVEAQLGSHSENRAFFRVEAVQE